MLRRNDTKTTNSRKKRLGKKKARRNRRSRSLTGVQPLEDRKLLAADFAGTAAWHSYVQEGVLADPEVSVAEPDSDGNIRVIIETTGKQQNDLVVNAFGSDTTNVTALGVLPIVIANVPVEDLDDISQMPNVRSVSVDYAVPAALADSVERINADVLHDNGNRGAGTTIAILDTGIDDTHDFFGTNGSRIVAQRCFSSAPTGGQSLCPNGQSTDTSASVNIPVCEDRSDECSHGTHVAGIAAGSASTDSDAPGDGVAPGAEIIAIQVFHEAADGDLGASFSDVIRGLDAVAELDNLNPNWNIVSANMSLGSGVHRTHCNGDDLGMTTAINELLFDHDIATVISAGNSGFQRSVGFPACISTAITVGSTTNGDGISGFSNRGALLDLFAPGGGDGVLGLGGIVSAEPGGEYGGQSGTSMAAPHVAGALAVLREADPTRSISELLADLQTNGVPITYDSFGTEVTTPRIDVLASFGGDNNDQISEATEILLGSTNTGNTLGEPYDVDMFEFSVLGGAQRVVIEVTERNNSNVDPFLRLFDENGTELASDSNNGSSAEIDFVLPGSGTYFVGVSTENNEEYNPQTGFGDAEGDNGGSFTLTISDNNDQLSEAISLSLNDPKLGNIDLASDVDLFAFNATAGQTVSFDVDRRDGSGLDSFLRLFNPAGNTVLAFDDDDSNPDGPLPEISSLESFIEFTFPTTDTYFLGVSSFQNSSYNLFDDTGDATGSTTGRYSLTAFVDNLDGNDQISEAISVPFGTTAGVFELFSSNDVTMFSTTVTAGQTVGFDVDNFGGSSLDAELRLWDEDGTLLAVDDDTNGPAPEFNGFEPYIEHTFNDAGTYFFSVAAFDNDGFDPISGLFDDGSTANLGRYQVSVTDETVTEPTDRSIVTIGEDLVGLDGETSLREAIEFANSNPGADTITFATSLNDSILVLTEGELNSSGITTIVGPGADRLTISGNDSSRIFDATGNLTIQDMTLANGNVGSGRNGGAILGDDVNIIRSRLIDNTAGNRGGAIHVGAFGDLVVVDSEFSGNSAEEGGAISISGGSGFLATGTITNSTISGNTADEGFSNGGGGIHAQGANLTVRNSTIAFNSSGIKSIANSYSNRANVSDSIVANNGREDFNGEVTLSDSLLGTDRNTTIDFIQSGDFILDRDPLLEPLAFNGGGATRTHKLLPASPAINTATASGQTPGFDQTGKNRVLYGQLDMGAYESFFEAESGVVTITGDVVALDGETSLREAIDNANRNGLITRVTFDPSLNGQTIQVTNGEILIDQSVSIEGPGADQLTISAGGSSRIFNLNSGSDDNPVDPIDDPTFANDGATFTIQDVTLTDGMVSDIGGAINLEDTLDRLVLDSVAITNNSGNAGGALRLRGRYEIKDSTFTDNSANFAGAAIFASATSSGQIVNSTISGNTSNSGAGAIQLQSNESATLQILNSTIADNTAEGVQVFTYGGGIGEVTIANSLFADNTGANAATSGAGSIASLGHNLSDDGSGVFNGTGDLTNTNPLLGPLQDNGGTTLTHAILAGSPLINAGDPAFSGLSFDQRGNGFSRVKQGRLDIGAFESNFNNAETPSLIVTISTDTVDNTDNETSLREAVTFANSNPGADTITFESGLSSVNVTGGEIAINESLTIDGPGADQLTINGNASSRLFNTNLDAGDSFTVQDITISGAGISSQNGGAIFHNDNSNLNVFRSRLTGNTANAGGAIYSLGTVTIEDSEIAGNVAADGGGVLVRYGELQLSNSTVSDNTATGTFGGGGVYLGDSTGTIRNTTISGNTAQGPNGGGGIQAAFHNNMLTIENSTIVDNHATGTTAGGGGLYADPQQSTIIRNTVIANNTANTGQNDVRSTVTANFSLFGDTTGSTITGSNNLLNVDPMLGGLADNGGLTLTHLPQPGSPLINGGDPGFSGLDFDQRGAGFNRVKFGRLDIGAIESDFEPSGLACDFDSDGECDGNDIDMLQANIVSGPADPGTFDLTNDGLVTVADRDEWLVLAGAENLASGNAYLPGDANLDGVVDASDFNAWNANKFTANSAWTSGDFNADGFVDGSDFNVWNGSKFTSSDSLSRSVDDGDDGDKDRREANLVSVLDQVFADFE